MTKKAKRPFVAASPAGKMRISLVPSKGSFEAKSRETKVAGNITRVMTVAFGSVTVEVVRAPQVAEIKRNVQAGQYALARAKTQIVKAGVHIPAHKGVPLFHADPKRPGKIVRELDGKRESGLFVDGKFMVG